MNKMILERIYRFGYALKVLVLSVVLVTHAAAQQVAIKGLKFENRSPAYNIGQGPIVKIHRSVSPYVRRGNFEPFLELVKTDGFKVDYFDQAIGPNKINEISILVVTNAYTSNFRNFSTLEAPSVYSNDEISTILTWVKNGGSLLVLADHSPFAGGTIKLANAFGFTYMTGWAINRNSLKSLISSRIDFSRNKATLSDHPITDGSTGRQSIDHYLAFSGQAIIPPPEAVSLLTIPNGYDALLGFNPSNEFDTAPRLDASGMSQGAAMEFGKGRLVIMGETGGFTAQIIKGASTFGFEEPQADQNKEFILSTMRWLAKFGEK